MKRQQKLLPRLAGLFFALLLAQSNAYALIKGEAIYGDSLSVPSFVPDVRSLILAAATRHTWKLIEEKPGELTFELRHAKTSGFVVAKAVYTKDEIRLQKLKEGVFESGKPSIYKADARTYERWMIGLRREIGLRILFLAIKDAGGTVREPASVKADPDSDQ